MWYFMNISKYISQFPEEEKTPVVIELLEIINFQYEENQKLKDEIARLKGEKGKPCIKPSTLEKPAKARKKSTISADKKSESRKQPKTESLEIHKEEIIKPEIIPSGSVFKGYKDYTVQDIIFQPFNTRYRLECWQTPDGEYIYGRLPDEISGSHFGPTLQNFILYQHYHSHVTQPLIAFQLWDIGVDISTGQISNILTKNNDNFHAEKDAILETGLKISSYIGVDDTGSRHQGRNGYCTYVGNDFFAWFESTESKNRINFLKILQGAYDDFVINPDALIYMKQQKLPLNVYSKISDLLGTNFQSEEEWMAKLAELEITGDSHVRIATEGALAGSIFEHDFNREMVILSDDAGQFNVFTHSLCWIHAERTINKLIGFDENRRQALETKQKEIWDFYGELKEYKNSPDEEKKKQLEDKFDIIFTEKTCFVSLNKALERIYKNKDELLLVLKRPEIPLHNNTSERDIREYVKKRKISGSTRSSLGRRSRDTFASIKKTCQKLGISFWEYLKARANECYDTIPYLPDLIAIRAKLKNA